MQSFSLLAALSALAANVNALCNEDLFAGICAGVGVEIQDAFDNSLYGDLEWQFRSTKSPGEDYAVNMVRLIGDANGDDVDDQWTKSPVLFYQRGDRPCFTWITEDTTASELFVAGHDVYIACRRGQDISSENPNDLSEEDYWNFDIEDVGRDDVSGIVEAINQIRTDESRPCAKTTIVTGGLSNNEVLAAAVSFPNDFNNFVSGVIGVNSCVVPFIEDESTPEGEEPPESNFEPNETYWMGVEILCNDFPEACYDYQYFFPQQAEEFCERFPDFCRPRRVDDFADFIQNWTDLGYWALWKDDDDGTFSEKVEAYCAVVGDVDGVEDDDEVWCQWLRSRTGIDHPPYSLKQFQHLYQISYVNAFKSFSDTFFADGWQDGAMTAADVDLSLVSANFFEIYGATADPICKLAETKEIMKQVPPGFIFQFINDELNSQNSTAFASTVNSILSLNAGEPDDCAAFGWMD